MSGWASGACTRTGFCGFCVEFLLAFVLIRKEKRNGNNISNSNRKKEGKWMEDEDSYLITINSSPIRNLGQLSQ
jgi:hypothetical protein